MAAVAAPAAAAAPPPVFLCPLSKGLMRDPVTASDGVCYERAAIERWLLSNTASPTTFAPLSSKALQPNAALRAAITAYRDGAARPAGGRRRAPLAAPKEHVQGVMQRRLGFRKFRPEQERVIRGVLDGRDHLVVMATGSGTRAPRSHSPARAL